MSKYFLFGFFLILSLSTFCQNLVPNPGFEQTVTCNYPLIIREHGEYPYSIDTSETFTPSVNAWFAHGSADYFNDCNPRFPYNYYSFLPRTGNGYVGIISIARFDSTLRPNYLGLREFIETRLLETLEAGCTYQVSFYVKLNPTPHVGASGVMGIDGMGMYISENRMTRSNWYSHDPQIKNPDGNILNDTSQYVEISGLYTALGGEKYISIGNFKTDTNTNIQIIKPHEELGISGSYYLVDDVSIIPLEASQYQLNIGKDTILCSESSFPVTLSAQSNFQKYHWSTGDSSQSLQVTSSGTYWVKADFGCGYLIDSITIYSKDSIEQKGNLGKDTVFCNYIPSHFSLEIPQGPYSIRWSTNATSNTILINSNGIYWVDLLTSCGIISDTILIKSEPSVQPIFLGNDSIICDTTDLSMELNIGNIFSSYYWSTGETTPKISINKLGKYWLTTYFQCGSSSDTITIYTKDSIEQKGNLGKDTVFCNYIPSHFSLEIPQGPYSIRWSTNATNNIIPINSNGIYWVDLLTSCGIISDTILIKSEPSVQPIFLGNDSIICDTTDLSMELNIGNIFSSYYWSTGETTPKISINELGKYWLTTYFQCGSSSDTIVLSTLEKPSPVFYRSDTSFCEGSLIDFNILNPLPNFNYQWDLSKTNSLQLVNSGIYKLSISNECASVLDSIHVHFINCEPYIPNLISVNNDGKNEVFEIITSTNRSMQVEIYNTWGQKVYHSEDYQNDWCPKDIPSGIYYYFIKDELLSKEYKGWIHVIK